MIYKPGDLIEKWHVHNNLYHKNLSYHIVLQVLASGLSREKMRAYDLYYGDVQVIFPMNTKLVSEI